MPIVLGFDYPVIADEGLALQILMSLVDASVAPLLDEPELTNLLAAARRASIWEASQSYKFGAIVQPTANNRNGHRFRLVKFSGGITSGSTEPSWPDSRDAEVVDGSLTWREEGTDYDSLWDLTAAARAGWLLKAGKAATCVDFEQDGIKFSASQVAKHCKAQADQYLSATVA